jgi:SAM-dependent methyltransferase
MHMPWALKKLTLQGSIWPPIDPELDDAKERGLLKGKILNAGAGSRDISHLIQGDLINQDILWEGEKRTHIHIFSPIHVIPRPDGFFDTVICLAVLEHVENPEEIVPEFKRVLKSGGHAVISVPFLQPEHKCPTDFQRYTRDGLVRLFAHHGFEVISVKPLFTVYHTLHWIVYEWLQLRQSVAYEVLRYIILPPLTLLAKRSKLQSNTLASAFQIIARKP